MAVRAKDVPSPNAYDRPRTHGEIGELRLMRAPDPEFDGDERLNGRRDQRDVGRVRRGGGRIAKGSVPGERPARPRRVMPGERAPAEPRGLRRPHPGAGVGGALTRRRAPHRGYACRPACAGVAAAVPDDGRCGPTLTRSPPRRRTAPAPGFREDAAFDMGADRAETVTAGDGGYGGRVTRADGHGARRAPAEHRHTCSKPQLRAAVTAVCGWPGDDRRPARR